MSARSAAFPGLPDALLLALLGWLTTQLFGVLLLRPLGINLAGGIGLAAGVGLVAALSWRALPEPRRQRLGLRGFPLRCLLSIALMLPVVLVGSELEQLMRSAFPPPDLALVARSRRALLATDTWKHAAQSLAITVALAPALEEWLFRGILQPGLVERLGVARGIALCSLLFGLWHGAIGLSPAAWLASFSAALLYGAVLGVVRHTSGSLLAAFLLHAGINGMAVLGAALHPRVAIPVWNAPGAHVPLPVLGGALAAVALGLVLALASPPASRPS